MPNTAPTGNNLADILSSMGVLTKEISEQVKMAEVQYGTRQEDIIKKQNLVSNENLVKAKAILFNIPYLDISSSPNSPEAMSILSQEVAVKFKVFPVSVDKQLKILTLAMADPMDLSAIEFVEGKTNLRVKPVASEEEKILDNITTRYATSLSQEVTEALKDVAPDRKVTPAVNYKIGFIREEKIAEIVSHILEFAVKSRSSDIHIEPQEKSTRVRYRIDGILQEKLTIPRELHDSLTSRIKILCGMKIDEKRIPQDGRFNFKANNEDTDLRVSSLPTSWGEKIVMRLLKKTGGVPDLPELGLRGIAIKNLQDAILRPHGIILICGPTGSGKTTTLYSIISRVNTPKVNIVTLEDPIEYKMAGVNQVQINPNVGLTFASGLKSFLRQDPNIILVGEIRDQETADLAVQASLTGHLVFSTLHTNDSSGALPRLLDMGAEPYLLASSMTAIMAQRVTRKIHEDCKESYLPDPKIIVDMKEILGPLWPQSLQDVKLYKGKGCQECGNSGYYGRIGIFEVLPVSDGISKLILERSPASAIEKKAKEEGMVTLKQDGYLKVLDGLTTIEEILRVAQE
ncbi:MAG: General secretory pathway protein E [Candidatus Woesebacteria bacterium GW2011_GWA1_33_30]|uniref:General secretory pathway protein E n=1 Tax=Candidatus Woesebacteria bacterium GW2011_GWA2_33_28 TaxID=1618561 RepID=A0A0F9ZUJ1_9BACT|nr:MAG: General secretory pathway protein E [Candidatus Woesebacteria bacterium GW2011_GWA2_33_28]KKP48856.1 MAG: General secretory pathway protein E [Candidatus Woesebacteria bacterium GW2011_GWA1_33_30]KKP50129.1 MAG: General secretory pathway protein E [Microgenomates group bacterium GW2011_GWC1_33_32]KKP51899.1 MAG: General secretory pathway protein E [Candidatus Woesebacteria bacterium GW2011_GWB1_33_38]KKP57335.1 MAG: General secretory pathway protein E [Microgenomates group bacterium GW2